ncbi:MAG: hypothetical protein VX152_08965 [Pseudomonadota bacterium]|nr:hypothetical protein [Pseudomonadota bacterium]
MKIAGLIATLVVTWFVAPAAMAQMTFRGVSFAMTDAELQQAGAELGLELGLEAELEAGLESGLESGADSGNPMAGGFVRFSCGALMTCGSTDDDIADLLIAEMSGQLITSADEPVFCLEEDYGLCAKGLDGDKLCIADQSVTLYRWSLPAGDD